MDFNPRESCDSRRVSEYSASTTSFDFNPRESCDSRLLCHTSTLQYGLFQSTRVLRLSTHNLTSQSLC